MPFLIVAKDGLTRKEIGWLLAQEARGAAHSLRKGFETQLRESILPPQLAGAESKLGQKGQDLPTVELNAPTLDSLAALDDAMSLLGDMHRSRESSHHRGRVDVAAMLIELWPDVALNILPGGGTEVFGDTDDIRRMIELLMAQASGPQILQVQNLAVTVSRQGDMVQVRVDLGPDAGISNAIESKWLSRLASRIGGRLTTTGRTQILELPADGAAHEREITALRLELSQAQELGEAYAKELSEMLMLSLQVEAERPKPFEVLKVLEAISRRSPEKVLELLSVVRLPAETLPAAEFIASLTTQPHVKVTRIPPAAGDAPISQRGEVVSPLQQVALKLSLQFLAQRKQAELEIQNVSSPFGLLLTLKCESEKEEGPLIGLRAFADEHKLAFKRSKNNEEQQEYCVY